MMKILDVHKIKQYIRIPNRMQAHLHNFLEKKERKER